MTPSTPLSVIVIEPEVRIDNEIVLSSKRSQAVDMVNKFDIGGIVEVGIGYEFKDRIRLFSYQHSFTSITNSYYFVNSEIRHNGKIIHLGF